MTRPLLFVVFCRSNCTLQPCIFYSYVLLMLCCIFQKWIMDSRGKTGMVLLSGNSHPTLTKVNRCCGSGSGIRNHLTLDSGSGIFLTLHPGSGMEKFVSGINIPDPLYWYQLPESGSAACCRRLNNTVCRLGLSGSGLSNLFISQYRVQ
jgi:hypothetical protein